jgi:hypothetical protein
VRMESKYKAMTQCGNGCCKSLSLSPPTAYRITVEEAVPAQLRQVSLGGAFRQQLAVNPRFFNLLNVVDFDPGHELHGDHVGRALVQVHVGDLHPRRTGEVLLESDRVLCLCARRKAGMWMEYASIEWRATTSEEVRDHSHAARYLRSSRSLGTAASPTARRWTPCTRSAAHKEQGRACQVRGG